MYSTHNKENFVIARRFIRALKNKIYKYITLVLKMSILKNWTIQLTNTAINIKMHTTDKMRPVDAKPNTYIDFRVDNNDKDPKFKTCDQERISKDKRIFVKITLQNWSEEFFAIRKSLKNTVLCTYVKEDLNGKENYQNIL